MASAPGQQQSAARWAVGAWKAFQLLIETLEAQAEAKRLAILKEQASGLFDIFGKRSLKQIDLAPIAATAILRNKIVPDKIVRNKIVFAVSRTRHTPPILSPAQLIAPDAPDD